MASSVWLDPAFAPYFRGAAQLVRLRIACATANIARKGGKPTTLKAPTALLNHWLRADMRRVRQTSQEGCMSARRVAVFVGFVSLAACVHTSATMLSTAPRPAVEPSAVVIYTSADRVPGKYDEIALLDSHGDDALTSYHSMLESMRKKAGHVGANGVILSTESEAGTGAKIAHALIGTSADRKGKAVAIVRLSYDVDSFTGGAGWSAVRQCIVRR